MTTSRISRFRDHPVIARCTPFALFIVFLVIASIASKVSPSAAGRSAGPDLNWLVLLRSGVVALALLWFWRNYSELRKPSPTHPGYWLLAVLTGFAVFLVWIQLDGDWAVLPAGKGFDPSLREGTTNWPMALWRLAGLALVVPVMEELFWRSLVLRWIERHDFMSVDPRRIGIGACLITAALFASEHDRWFAGGIAGLLYNWLYMRSGNLWVPIVAHAVTNAALGIWILNTQSWHFW